MNVLDLSHNPALTASWRDAGDQEHFVQFYEQESALVESVTEFIEHRLQAGTGVIVIATAAHLQEIEHGLRVRGFDPPHAIAQQQLAMLDASATLASIMRQGAPQRSRFLDVVGTLVADMRRRRSRVSDFGEMVSLLWQEGQHRGALQLEQLWNELGERERFSLYCAHPLPQQADAMQLRGLERVCGQRGRLIPGETSLQSGPQARLRLGAQLRQKAAALEWEAHRRTMAERALAERDRELSDLLENALEGLLKVGPDGTLFWSNGAGLELLGCCEEQCIGRAIADFHLDPLDARQSLERLLAGGSLRNHATVLRRVDGSVRHVRIAANALWDAGKLIHSRWFVRDVTEERLAEGARAHLASIVESSDDAIVSKTLDGVILSWNRAAERLFGYSADEAVGQPITLIIPPERTQEEAQILSELRGGRRVDHFETVRVAKNGRRIHVALTISPIRNSGGAIVGASKIARDITERKASEQAQQRFIGELKRAEEALREADRRKDEFLAVLAHELRNPLAPIRYAVAMARKEDRTEAQRTQAQAIIERQVEHMGRLLDDLLDVSRITRGTLMLRRSSIDLASAVAAAQEAARPLIEARGHTLAVRLPQEPVRLVADPVRLAQILANLLVNAAKYTDSGGRIELEASREGEEVSVTVRDNGIGISAEMMPRMFILFAQASPALERSEGGLGIGLSLVRGLAELHGGRVCAYSKDVGQGSEFVLRLPVGQPEEAADGRESEPDAGGRTRPLRLLVADDNCDSAATCAALLEASGHAVSVAHTGREAFDLACRVQPDALLLDIGMPELNGYQLARRIRRTGWGQRPLLIAISGWGQDQDKRRALAAGFDLHLTKPIDPGGLEALLQRAETRPRLAEPDPG
jgi:PAS domain S-box-containing protein